ncbi:hypothetical protein V1478_012069 [Vespula squamosa]|uniref:Uncharacterized protein n=1 Tax=Vespula squamosa TaxID=30214 RepID=A0ABD2AC53_VESSQ
MKHINKFFFLIFGHVEKLVLYISFENNYLQNIKTETYINNKKFITRCNTKTKTSQDTIISVVTICGIEYLLILISDRNSKNILLGLSQILIKKNFFFR